MNQPAPAGFLNIDKPIGITSFDVVRAVRRLTGIRKVGHGGTLDPDAGGVLPIAIGRATRFIDAVLHGGKEYTATGRLGVATDTYDASGAPILETDPSGITEESLRSVLPQFRGDIQQVPPMYSALKQDGKRLYEMARAGIEIEREARPVRVDALHVVDWSPPEFTLKVECGSGFYARSLIHDIGAALDNAAHLSGLTRDRSGPFTLDEAISIDELERSAGSGDWTTHLQPVDIALQDLPRIVLDPVQEEHVRHGRRLELPPGKAANEKARAYDADGLLLAVLLYDPPMGWRTEKVLVR